MLLASVACGLVPTGTLVLVDRTELFIIIGITASAWGNVTAELCVAVSSEYAYVAVFRYYLAVC
jgi:hypothetical protein